MPWWGWKWGWGMVFSVQNRFKVTKDGHFWISRNYLNWVRLIPLIITKCSCHWLRQCIAKMPDFSTVPLMLCLTKCELDINVFVSLNSFAVSQRTCLAHFLLIRSNGELHRNKYFVSFTFLTTVRFQGYRWKSGIAFFVWRVTENFAYIVP